MINLKKLTEKLWSQCVHKTGNETITGDKAFTGSVTVGGYDPECVVDKKDEFQYGISGIPVGCRYAGAGRRL